MIILYGLLVHGVLLASGNSVANDEKEIPRKRYSGILVNFDYRNIRPKSLLTEAEHLMELMESVHSRVGNIPKESVTFDRVVKPLIDLDGHIRRQFGALLFPKSVATDKVVREASAIVEKQLTELKIDLSLRKDVYANIKTFLQSKEALHMTTEQQRYCNKAIRDGKRNGLMLTGEKLEEFKITKKRISELKLDFSKCLREDSSHFYASEQELYGVPTDVIDSMEKDDDGKRKVTREYPHYFPVMQYCKNPQTRYTMLKTFQSRCVEENTPIIEELISLRHRHANILGYPTHAAFVLEERMAKNPETVRKFLEDLTSKFKVLWNDEKEVLLKLKELEAEELELESNGELALEDKWYYQTLVKKKLYSVDHKKLKEYFPLEKVTEGMMKIYQRILGLKFTKLNDGQVWHEDVLMYQVDDKDSEETLGYFFLDLHPRDGKFGHAAMWDLQLGHVDGGERQKAVATMVCNFPKPSGDKPALLEHSQVKTFFHEFGHVMNGICSKANISIFAGLESERDFVEAPSQMLENWVWEEESLKMISGHYKDGSPIPRTLLKNLIGSRTANNGGKSLGQMFTATYDLILHSQNQTDTVQLSSDLYREFFGIERIKGTNKGATLGHLIGYDAGYYGYMWSRVFSQDMFATRFGKEGIFNTTTGMDYRNKILAPGASKDGSEMIQSFLGREPNKEAFLKSMGL